MNTSNSSQAVISTVGNTYTHQSVHNTLHKYYTFKHDIIFVNVSCEFHSRWNILFGNYLCVFHLCRWPVINLIIFYWFWDSLLIGSLFNVTECITFSVGYEKSINTQIPSYDIITSLCGYVLFRNWVMKVCVYVNGGASAIGDSMYFLLAIWAK